MRPLSEPTAPGGTVTVVAREPSDPVGTILDAARRDGVRAVVVRDGVLPSPDQLTELLKGRPATPVVVTSGNADGAGLPHRLGRAVVLSPGDLVDVEVEAIVDRGLPVAPTVAIIGDDLEFTDDIARAVAAAGLLSAVVTRHTEQRLRLLVPGCRVLGGAVVVPLAGGDRWLEALETLREDPGVDILVVVSSSTDEARTAALHECLVRVVLDRPAATTVLVRHETGPTPSWDQLPVPCAAGAREAVDLLTRW